MRYSAPVIRGKGRGKLLGFPTFNLVVPAKMETQFGIYAARVWIEGQEYAGALHYGPIPTFQDEKISLEVFILDYNLDIQLSHLQFELAGYLRAIQNFSNSEDLHHQIAQDVKEVRAILK